MTLILCIYMIGQLKPTKIAAKGLVSDMPLSRLITIKAMQYFFAQQSREKTFENIANSGIWDGRLEKNVLKIWDVALMHKYLNSNSKTERKEIFGKILPKSESINQTA
jgi:hypothetical protein